MCGVGNQVGKNKLFVGIKFSLTQILIIIAIDSFINLLELYILNLQHWSNLVDILLHLGPCRILKFEIISKCAVEQYSCDVIFSFFQDFIEVRVYSVASHVKVYCALIHIKDDVHCLTSIYFLGILSALSFNPDIAAHKVKQEYVFIDE